MTERATSAPLPHVRDLGAQSPGSDVRAFLRELSAWLADRQYRLEEARDERDAAYRRGWNAAIAHVAEHAAEHQAIADEAGVSREMVQKTRANQVGNLPTSPQPSNPKQESKTASRTGVDGKVQS